MSTLLQKVKSILSASSLAPGSQGDLEQKLADLPARFAQALLSMYRGEPQIGSDGKTYNIDGTTRISPEQGIWIYNLCRETKPESTFEIGLAYGFSTLYFLAAIHANGSGTHLAVDPFQEGHWHGIGIERARIVGMTRAFQFANETSVTALTRCAGEGVKFEIIFIDGNHRFDDVLVDFILAIPICKQGGHIILDDTWMPSIQKAVAFIGKNRTDFTQVRGMGHMAVFRKTGTDAREWSHFVSF